jgi:N-terminal domain of anti-restriction factor ArdC
VSSSRDHDRRSTRQAKLDALSDRLEQAVGQLVSGEDWLRAVEFAARFRSRSFTNTLLIYLQHTEAYVQGRLPSPEPTYVAGFRQWQRLGRSVVKGQSGYMIRSPVTARFASTDPSDPASWRRLDRGEQPRPGEQVRVQMTGVKPGYVWDVSQTDGDPLPEPPRPVLLDGQAPPGLWDGLAAQVHARGFQLADAPDTGALSGANGVTDFTASTVTVRADMPDAARTKTLAHELAHIVLGHEARGDDGLHRGIGEVEAESVATMVTAAHGMDTSDYTVPYVAHWSATVEDRGPVEVVRGTGELVRRTALAILDRLPEPPGGDGTPPGLHHPTGVDHERPTGQRRQPRHDRRSRHVGGPLDHLTEGVNDDRDTTCQAHRGERRTRSGAHHWRCRGLAASRSCPSRRRGESGVVTDPCSRGPPHGQHPGGLRRRHRHLPRPGRRRCRAGSPR